MNSTRRIDGVVAVFTASAALVSTLVLLNAVPSENSHTDSVARLTTEFHASYSQWRPEHGVRSPCPAIQNELNIALLAKHGLLRADADRVVVVTGLPLSICQHKKYPAIKYWKTRSYWITMAPKCVMLLPRNSNYDAMMKMSMQEDAVICDDNVTHIRTMP